MKLNEDQNIEILIIDAVEYEFIPRGDLRRRRSK